MIDVMKNDYALEWRTPAGRQTEREQIRLQVAEFLLSGQDIKKVSMGITKRSGINQAQNRAIRMSQKKTVRVAALTDIPTL